MKKITLYFTGFAFASLLFSCGTTNVTRFGNDDLEVAATTPKATQENFSQNEIAAPIETSDAAIVTEKLPVVNVSKTTKAAEKFNANAQKLSQTLKTLSASTDDAFTKKTLSITANNVDRVSINAEKLSILDKIKLRLFGKMFNRYAEKLNNSMDTADILAICALVSGCLAWLWYAAFVFGIAAIVLGVIALKKGASRRGMALAGLILGAVALLFWILWAAVIVAIVL